MAQKTRLTISLPVNVLALIDDECERTGESRSGFLSKAATEVLEMRETSRISKTSPEQMVQLLESLLRQEKAKLAR